MIDELSDRNYTLSQMSLFPSFEWYANAWDELGADMEMAGRLCTAENCRTRAKHYREVAERGDGVIRFLENGTVKLVELNDAVPTAVASGSRQNVELNPPQDTAAEACFPREQNYTAPARAQKEG